jgi:hypothetical protein
MKLMKARILLLLLFPGFSFARTAESFEDLANNPQDSSYIRKFKDQPHLTFEFARRNQEIRLINPLNESQSVNYEPNTRVSFITSFDYRWLSLSLGLFSYGAADSDKKGDTEQFNLKFSFNGRRIWNTNYIQAYQGYFQNNPLVSNPNWNPQTEIYPQRPDIFNFTFFSNIAYCFRPDRFSYRAALWQLDRQEKSAGSFIAGLSYRFNLIDSDSSITMIPFSLYNDFQPNNRAVSVRQSTFTFHGGYIHTFVAKKSWFCTLYFLPGIAFESGFYRPDDLRVRNFKSATTLATEFRIILGYNGLKWFGGISGHSLSYAGNRKADLWVDSSFGWVRFFGGYRFNQVDRTKGSKLLRAIGL